MARVLLLAAAITASVALTFPASAQHIGGTPMPHLHAINPSLSLSTPQTSPLQQQIQQDYRGSLLNAQRELPQSNPSSLSRQQLTIGQQLDEYNAAPP